MEKYRLFPKITALVAGVTGYSKQKIQFAQNVELNWERNARSYSILMCVPIAKKGNYQWMIANVISVGFQSILDLLRGAELDLGVGEVIPKSATKSRKG